MKVRKAENGWLTWHCPGCEGGHGVPVEGERKWDWNGSLEAPTLRPSVLIMAHKSSPPFKDQPRCHVFIHDGRIKFLPDCEHALAGQTVTMEDDE